MRSASFSLFVTLALASVAIAAPAQLNERGDQKHPSHPHESGHPHPSAHPQEHPHPHPHPEPQPHPHPHPHPHPNPHPLPPAQPTPGPPSMPTPTIPPPTSTTPSTTSMTSSTTTTAPPLPSSGFLSFITSGGDQSDEYLSESEADGDATAILASDSDEVWTLASDGRLTSTNSRTLSTDGTYVLAFGDSATVPSGFSAYICTANSASTQGQVILDCSAPPTSAQGNFDTFFICENGVIEADGNACNTVDGVFSQLTLSPPTM